jgi:cardiolipin synthase
MSTLFSRALAKLRFRHQHWLYTHGSNRTTIAGNILERFKPHLKALEPNVDEKLWQHSCNRWKYIIENLIRLGGCSDMNKIQVFTNGSLLFQDLWNEIDSAKQKIWLETYTLTPDVTGLNTLAKLALAAKRGVEVELILDSFGSSAINEDHLMELKENGGNIIFFNPIYWNPLHWRQNWMRNHRKICIVDQVGYCGGMNIADCYSHPIQEIPSVDTNLSFSEMIGLTKLTKVSKFRDTHFKIEGEAVSSLANIFMESYEEGTKIYEHPTLLDNPTPTHPTDSNQFIQLISQNPRKARRNLKKSVSLLISEANRNCYITTPYFLPPFPVAQAILKAVERGVNVTILTCGLSDVGLVRLGSTHLYGKFLKAGVKIHEYFGMTLHSKTITVDGLFSSVGSFNLDRLSYFANMEVGMNVIDCNVAKQLEMTFENDLKYSKPLTLEDWNQRPLYVKVLGSTLYKAMRLIGP